MKKFSSILFIAVLFVSVFAQGVVIMRYHINKQYIAKVLCENKSRPKLNCDGKCVLAKKLKAQEKQQKNQGIFFSEKFEVSCMVFSATEVPSPYFVIIDDTKIVFNQKPVYQPGRTILRPPDFC